MPFQKKDEVSQDEVQREEDYEKLFPKIARDFVGKDDLAVILSAIVSAVPGLTLDILDVQATLLAKEYKKNLDEGNIDPKKYKDVIELEDDE